MERTTVGHDGAVQRSTTLQLHGVTLLSLRLSKDSAGHTTIDASGQGEPDIHLDGTNAAHDWTGRVGGKTLSPVHVDDESRLGGLSLTYTDGSPVLATPLDKATWTDNLLPLEQGLSRPEHWSMSTLG